MVAQQDRNNNNNNNKQSLCPKILEPTMDPQHISYGRLNVFFAYILL